jgi:magnesium transporter
MSPTATYTFVSWDISGFTSSYIHSLLCLNHHGLQARVLKEGASAGTFPLWAVGVLLIVVGSIGNNLGNILVSLGHRTNGGKIGSAEIRKKTERQEADPEMGTRNGSDECTRDTTHPADADDVTVVESDSSDENKCCGKSCLTCSCNCTCTQRTFGIIVFVIGNLMSFSAFGFAAQSLLASLESIQFVSNIFFVRYFHQETITWRMILATLLIIAGNVLVVLFSEHDAPLYTSDEILYIYNTNKTYWGYLVAAFVLWIFMVIVNRQYEYARIQEGKLLWRHGFVEPVTYAVASAIIGTQAVLHAKCLSMILQITFRGVQNEFLKPTLYWTLVLWALLGVFWVRRLDRALAIFPPVFIIPVMQVMFVLFAIICGGVFFEEFLDFSVSQYVGFVFGVLLILIGVYGLAPPDIDIVKVPELDFVVPPTPSPSPNPYTYRGQVDEIPLPASPDTGVDDFTGPVINSPISSNRSHRAHTRSASLELPGILGMSSFASLSQKSTDRRKREGKKKKRSDRSSNTTSDSRTDSEV